MRWLRPKRPLRPERKQRKKVPVQGLDGQSISIVVNVVRAFEVKKNIKVTLLRNVQCTIQVLKAKGKEYIANLLYYQDLFASAAWQFGRPIFLCQD